MMNRRDVVGLIQALTCKGEAVPPDTAAGPGQAEAVGVRAAAAFALAKIGGAQAVALLVTALQDDAAAVRQNAAAALYEVGDRTAVEPLVTLLGDESEKVRQNAALALWQIDRGQVGRFLVASLRGRDAEASSMAGAALASIGGHFGEVGVRQTILDSVVVPAFEWSKKGFTGAQMEWAGKIRTDHEAAIGWVEAQDFVPLPTRLGDAHVAQYCYEMAYKAENHGILKEAWAGYHQALGRFLKLDNDRMVAMTCFRLGNVHGAQGAHDMAELYFLHSAYLTKKTGDTKGYGWSLVYLGQTMRDQGAVSALPKLLWLEARDLFRGVSPGDVPAAEDLLRGLD